MGEGKLELTIIAAEGLKNVNILGMGKINPYAIAWIDPQYKKSTQALQNSGTSPAWNETLILPVDTHLLNNPNGALVIQVLCTGSLLKTKIIGTTSLMLNEIKRICSIRDRDEHEGFILQLWRPSGRAYGVLRVALKLKGSGLFEELDVPTNRVVNGPQLSSWGSNNPPLSNWAVSNPQTFDWALTNNHPEVKPCDFPVQGIPVASLYPNVASSDEREVSSTDEQCGYPNGPKPTAPYMHPSPDRVISDTVKYSTLDEQCVCSNDSQPPAEQSPVCPSTPPVKQNEASKNFFIGLLSGAVAAVLVGSAVVGN